MFSNVLSGLITPKPRLPSLARVNTSLERFEALMILL
jgi:hypothetical protein